MTVQWACKICAYSGKSYATTQVTKSTNLIPSHNTQYNQLIISPFFWWQNEKSHPDLTKPLFDKHP